MPIKFVLVFALIVGVPLAATLRADEPASGGTQMSAAAGSANKAAKSDDGKLHGRLPQYYSKLDVSTEQRQTIYRIQSSYAAKKTALEQQLDELKSQCSAETRAVLTADQQAKLDELVSERKSKKLKDAKSIAKGNMPASDDGKVTESAAK